MFILIYFNFIDEKININCENLTEKIQEHFHNEILTVESEKKIPYFAPEVKNNSLVKVSMATIIQDCIEDEFYQPSIKTEGNLVINSGLWTSSMYDPNGLLTDISAHETDYSKLKVRKRLLATCKTTEITFILSIYRQGGHGTDEEWENWRQEIFKMNSVHELIGIYESQESQVSQESQESQESSEEVFPTIHLIKRSEWKFDNWNSTVISIDEFEGIRSRLLKYLSDCLGGSNVAAEALMLSLVSRPSMRVEGLLDSLFVGKLTLNLCVKDSDPQIGCNLSDILKGIKPFVSGPVHVNSDPNLLFAKESIYPRLNVQTGQIIPGALLQQPDGCILIVDESGLKEGEEFKDQAFCNLRALIDLIRFQHVNYDFGMQQVQLNTDIPVITVSCGGKKSVLPFELKVDCDTVKKAEASEEELKQFAAYLNRCRSMDCVVSETMTPFLEQAYVALRKSSDILKISKPKMNEEEFHRLMNLARLYGVSHGKNELTTEIWYQSRQFYN